MLQKQNPNKLPIFIISFLKQYTFQRKGNKSNVPDKLETITKKFLGTEILFTVLWNLHL